MNAPKLRFKEFNDGWQKKELREISQIYDGTHQTPNYIQNGVPFVSVEDISDIEKTNKFISKNAFEKEFKIKPQVNDILMTRITAGIIGATAIIKNNNPLGYYVSLALIRKNKEIDVNYLNQYINCFKFKKELNKKIIHVAFPKKINLGDIGKCKISITSINEQQKIGKMLNILDRKIELQSKKIEDLKLFKKGLHDKLFNEVTGNDYLLSDIAIFENGKGHENIVDENGKYILINSKFISTEGNVTKKCSEQLTPLFKNDITMVMSDLPNGKALAKCYYIDENNKYSLNQRICKIKIKDDSIINSKYLFYLLDRNPYYLRFDDGVNQTNLKKDDILSLNLVLPSIKDQERNSKTLTIIDNFIEKENNKLSKLNLLKKGLMQSMFV